MIATPVHLNGLGVFRSHMVGRRKHDSHTYPVEVLGIGLVGVFNMDHGIVALRLSMKHEK